MDGWCGSWWVWLVVGLVLACSGGEESSFSPAEIEAEDILDEVGLAEVAADGSGEDLPWQGILDLSEETDDGTVAPDLVMPDKTTPNLCQGNSDGSITANELPVEAAMGLVSTFTLAGGSIALPAPGITGTFDAEAGGHLWDFTAPLAGDAPHYESLLPVESFWFSQHYPSDTFVQPFSADNFGVYSQDEEALWLHGIASAQAGDEPTALVYEEPIKLLAFPLKKGKSWSAEDVAADGLFEGDEYPADYGLAGTVSIRHSYHFTVDKAGTAAVPMGSFDVLRVYADVEMSVWNSQMLVPVASQRVKLVYFVAECAGTVALVRSLDDEIDAEFTTASEVKRLGLIQ